MKTKFVKTSNYKALLIGLEQVKNSAKEARILLLTSEPGTGKSRCCDYWGSLHNAIYIDGIPTMNVTFVRELLAHELGVKTPGKFAQHKAIQDSLIRSRQAIILDEAQHGLDKKAEVIEYLRRLAESAGSTLILVCHTSERHRFGEHSLAHIATRISSVVQFKSASAEDTALYLTELCEVGIDAGIVEKVFEESQGRYRLMALAITSLEELARQKGLTELSIKDIGGHTLCQDVMAVLKKG